MKKATVLLSVLMLAICTFSFAQDKATAILPFEEGKILTDDDIAFLDLVVNGPKDKARGTVKEVTIDQTKIKKGSTVSKEVAESIKKKIKDFSAAHKDKVTEKPKEDVKTRGCGYYCYYYYYDYGCYCYRYVWYYCCL